MQRHEFLYEITFWEVRRLIRGFRRRDRLKHQLLAECAFAAIYVMRDPKGTTVSDMFPMLFEEEDEHRESISEEEQKELQELMAAINRKHADK